MIRPSRPSRPPGGLHCASSRKSAFLAFFLILVALVCSGPPAWAQGRSDVLNEQEADLVRLAQEIDERTALFLKIAERRLVTLEGGEPPAPAPAKAAKGEDARAGDKFGPPPGGPRDALLRNYVAVIEEMQDKIDDAYERNANNPKIKKSLENVRKTLEGYLPRLKALSEKVAAPAEGRALEAAALATEKTLADAKAFLNEK